LRRATPALGIVIGLVGVVFVVRELVRNRAEVLAAAGGADPLVLALALLVGLASMTSIGLAWRRCLALLGVQRPAGDTLRRYFVGQLGKYVPGGIWPVVGRAEMARRGGVPASAAYGSTLLSMAMAYLAATLTLAAAALVAGAGRVGEVAWQPVVAILPLGVLALHPSVLAWGLGVFRRVTKREIALPIPTWPVSIGLLVRHVPAWIGVSVATWLVASTLDPGAVDVRNLVFATSLSWVVGFLAVGVPGGIGVREAVFVASATSLSSSGVAAAVAVVSRAVFVLVDLGGAGIVTIVFRGRSPLATPPFGSDVPSREPGQSRTA
jgi:glycosyltransferase 2 family protein